VYTEGLLLLVGRVRPGRRASLYSTGRLVYRREVVCMSTGSSVASELSVERVNELIRLFGENQKREMRAEKRETMRSVLFDLPRRSSLGWQCLHDNQGPFLRELAAHTAPEELGRRMRVPGSRPYALQPFILVCTHLGHRQQRMLDLGLRPGDPFPEERPEELAFLMDFWARLQGAYRSDDELLPGEAGGALPILDDEQVRDLEQRCRPVDEDRYVAIRRMAATLELFGFMLHGEQRDGIFGHGPYELDGGRVLWLREFNDLRNDYLPWADTRVRNALDNVIVAYVGRDVAVTCDMFGSSRVEPHDPTDRLEGVAVLTNEGGTLRDLSDDEIEAMQHSAADGQEELFMKAVEWDDAYKISYGGPLFANHLKPFFDLARMPGADDAARRLMAACDATAQRHVDELLGADVPSFWRHVGTTEDDLYWPMVA
jgi:hypothetical protein